jgi:hypothetical protein
MSRVAIIGSCITRDLWPILGEEPDDLLYVSRTSLPSLVSQAVPGFLPDPDPHPVLTRAQHRWVASDLTKQGLETLVAHQPTHIIFDFVDERFDLLAVGDALATHSFELEISGYLDWPMFAHARPAPRLSAGVERLWLEAAGEIAELIAATPLRDATILLHETQWATAYRDAAGQPRPFEDVRIWGDRAADVAAHNALLARYQAAFKEKLPQAVPVSAPEFQTGDAGHRWGLSPFHYVPEYYAEIWKGLRAAGV